MRLPARMDWFSLVFLPKNKIHFPARRTITAWRFCICLSMTDQLLRVCVIKKQFVTIFVSFYFRFLCFTSFYSSWSEMIAYKVNNVWIDGMDYSIDVIAFRLWLLFETTIHWRNGKQTLWRLTTHTAVTYNDMKGVHGKTEWHQCMKANAAIAVTS